MLYLLQVDVLVAIAIFLPFFAVYAALTVLRLGYFAAIRFVHIVKARIPRAGFGDVMADDRNAKRPLAIVAVTNPRRRFEPERRVTGVDVDTGRRSARRVA
jgi:hypothetical protein